MNIAVYTIYSEMLANRMFELADGVTANSESSERYHALQNYLNARGIIIKTYDTFSPNDKIDHWIFIDPPGDIYRFMLSRRVNPRNSLLFMVEPPVGNPSLYRRGWLYFRIFGRVLSWNSDLVTARQNFSKFLLPYCFDTDSYNKYRSTPKSSFCVMMHSNKMSSLPGELYTLRRNIITYFEQRGDNLLDLYGKGWNEAESPDPFFSELHKGWFGDKRACLASYSFSLCIDNMLIPGYLTYDPFISMSVGTVPVYLPMPDADGYIPRDTYVDFGAFTSMDELVEHLVALRDNGGYEEMRERGWQFINSKAYRPFTVEKFCEDVHDALMLLAEREK